MNDFPEVHPDGQCPSPSLGLHSALPTSQARVFCRRDALHGGLRITRDGDRHRPARGQPLQRPSGSSRRGSPLPAVPTTAIATPQQLAAPTPCCSRTAPRSTRRVGRLQPVARRPRSRARHRPVPGDRPDSTLRLEDSSRADTPPSRARRDADRRPARARPACSGTQLATSRRTRSSTVTCSGDGHGYFTLPITGGFQVPSRMAWSGQ